MHRTGIYCYYCHTLNACGLKNNNNPHITKGERHLTLSYQSMRVISRHQHNEKLK